MSNLNLSELSKEIASKHVSQIESALSQYVKSAIQLLEDQGKDITVYTLVSVSNPMQLKDDHSVRITNQWKIIKVSELENIPRIWEDL